MKKIAFHTLGCKVNQVDTAAMENMFIAEGYELVDFNQTADVFVINTCVVTNTGQRKSRQAINRAIRKNPEALVVVTGCYPQTAEEEVRAIEGVDLIVGNQDRSSLVALVKQAQLDTKVDTLSNVRKLEANTTFEELSGGNNAEKTRAYLKIQEGCNQYCTYCIIPYARGPLRSRSLESIKEEVAKLVVANYKEVVLIGIHLGCYGKESGEGKSLYEAVNAALTVTGLERLRLGSLESVEVEDELLELMASNPKLCPHLHLPLQSGCDKILKAMHRPYSTEQFKILLSKIKNKIPGISITTDIIVGFPGETDADFEETYNFAKECGFAKMHIFPYSIRQGTPAANFPDQVPENIKQERANKLAELDATMHKNFLEANLGKTLAVLVEQSVEAGLVEGLSENYLRVWTNGDAELSGKIVNVKVTKLYEDGLFGDIV